MHAKLSIDQQKRVVVSATATHLPTDDINPNPPSYDFTDLNMLWVHKTVSTTQGGFPCEWKPWKIMFSINMDKVQGNGSEDGTGSWS